MQEPGADDPVPPDPGRRDRAGADLDRWYDDEVLAALNAWRATPSGASPLPSRLVGWGRRSLMGAVITGWALGIQEVLEPKREESIVIEVDADGEPHDLPVRLFLDPDDPSGSLCVVRRDPPPPVV